eukprot:SAG31_NODE_4104_length_3579_cov_2.748851_3_plen_154_part_00
MEILSEPLQPAILVLLISLYKAKICRCGKNKKRLEALREAATANRIASAIAEAAGTLSEPPGEGEYSGPALDFAGVVELVMGIGFIHVDEDWLRGYWAAYDVNNDGVLDADEVTELLAALRRNFEPLNEQQAFDLLTTKMGFDITRAFFAGAW